MGKPKVLKEIFDLIDCGKLKSLSITQPFLEEEFNMMTKEEATEKAKKIYWISDIVYGKLKKNQKNNHWYGISVPKCLQDFDKMEMIDANTNIFRIHEPVDCNYHRSQIIILD